MKGTHCDGKGGWTRVTNNIDHGVCGRSISFSGGCSSTTFSTLGLNYYKVCGQVRGYQHYSPDSFQELYLGIDTYYAEGVSITYGQNSRKHI